MEMGRSGRVPKPFRKKTEGERDSTSEAEEQGGSKESSSVSDF